MSELKTIPKFKNEVEEREFWTTHDSTGFVDWHAGEFVSFPKLKPTMKTISLQLPEFIVDELRIIARKRDVSYQSLIKIFIKERIDQVIYRHFLPKEAPTTSTFRCGFFLSPSQSFTNHPNHPTLNFSSRTPSACSRTVRESTW
ncbi:MAG: hypothetical protein ILNGONEN_01628 [Syntrophorhabdaceae bacterium]|nr:hypothetical protein [Syntrophorhabdaceae bacterium]